ncbi:MAG: hypothetical protein JXR96_03245 [Deltaproteobacteria bacterium]|nr:hypothetical protein [Deltaproteobacteria bacterium]
MKGYKISAVICIAVACVACSGDRSSLHGFIESELGDREFVLISAYYWSNETGGVDFLATNINCDCLDVFEWFDRVDEHPQYNLVMWLERTSPGDYNIDADQEGAEYTYTGEIIHVEDDSFCRWYPIKSGVLKIRESRQSEFLLSLDVVGECHDGRVGTIDGSILTRLCVEE